MRAIDADAFKEYITEACEDLAPLFNDNGKVARLVTENFCKDIDEQPTIQPEPLQPWEVLVAQAVLPQPEIVRCKDCGHRDDHGCCKYWRGLAMSETPIATDDYDFCNHARRREREH